MTTTKRSNPQTMLKAALVTGSLAATLLGTRVIARNDGLPGSGPAATPIVVTVPVEMAVQQGVPPAVASTQSQANPELTLALPPIPQAISPVIPAVTQTQSSR